MQDEIEIPDAHERERRSRAAKQAHTVDMSGLIPDDVDRRPLTPDVSLPFYDDDYEDEL